MASVARLAEAPQGSTQFMITVGRAEKQRWKEAADAAGLSIAEYVRRAVQQTAEAPTREEIAEARALALTVDTAAARMEAMLDRTIARIEAVIDPTREATRRAEILAELDRSGLYLDLDALAADPR